MAPRPARCGCQTVPVRSGPAGLLERCWARAAAAAAAGAHAVVKPHCCSVSPHFSGGNVLDSGRRAASRLALHHLAPRRPQVRGQVAGCLRLVSNRININIAQPSIYPKDQ